MTELLTPLPIAARVPDSGRLHSVAAAILAPVICVGVGLLVWMVFQPGFMDGDGLGAYASALHPPYNDWNPPLLPIILHGLLRHGYTHSTLVLIQCVAGSLGAYLLARQCISFWYRDSVSVAGISWAAWVVFIVMMCPISPLAYYLGHFGKDTWALVSVLWLGVCAFNLYWVAVEKRFGWFGVCNLLLFIFCMVLLIEVRYNTLLLVPIFWVMLFALLRVFGLRRALVLSTLAIMLPSLVDFGIHKEFNVLHTHPEDQVLATELVGACVIDPKHRKELPFTDSHLVDSKYRQGYVWGDANPLAGWAGDWCIVKPGYFAGSHEQLWPEYRHFALHHPGLMWRIKVKAFLASMLDPEPFWHHYAIDAPNDYGQVLNPKFAAFRDWYFTIDRWIYNDIFLRWVGARHLPWFLLTAASVIVLGIAGGIARRPKLLFAALVLLIPLGYFLTYVAAMACHNYRYMYPATAFIEVMAIAVIVGWAFRPFTLSQRVRDLRRQLQGYKNPAGGDASQF
jgi:hypothetical protein